MLVSVIIPTHNRPKLLLRAINSVLNQTHQEIEVIVVVDRPEEDTTPRFNRCVILAYDSSRIGTH